MSLCPLRLTRSSFVSVPSKASTPQPCPPPGENRRHPQTGPVRSRRLPDPHHAALAPALLRHQNPLHRIRPTEPMAADPSKTAMKASVYLETTILSYLVARPSRDLVVAAHQQITREWWDKHEPHFRCYISQAVLGEIQRGDSIEVAKRLDIARRLESLIPTDGAMGLAQALLQKRIVPQKALQDAIHIAVAATSGMDFLLTWNCTHIANARIEARIADLCRENGLKAPVICTPEELMVP